MSFSARLSRLTIATLFLGTSFAAQQNSPAQASPPAVPSGPNSDPTYQQLRNITLGSESISVEAVDLKRDAATFHLKRGTVCFVPPVQGKVTGAVFVGEGTMTLDPPTADERRSLKLLTKSDEFAENFSDLVLRFTDSTYDELKKAGGRANEGCNSGNLLRDSQNAMRHHPALKVNLDGRILEDVLSPEPGRLFFAFVHGNRYNGKELFMIDPHGARFVHPEEVEFMTYDENKFGIWAAFHLAEEYKNGTAVSSQKNAVIHIDHQQLDTTIEKNANLIGKATTSFVSNVNGLRVVPFDLYRTLRVESVALENGQPLSFIQEDKKDDADFFVVLPKALSTGDKCTVVTQYSGKEAVSNEGNGNYFPIARENWYPNNIVSNFGEYTAFDMTFHIPKGMKIAATGTLVNESTDGKQDVTAWKSEVPQTVAGFNFGLFKMEEATLTQPAYLIQSYANQEPPDWVKSILNRANGDLPTSLAGPRERPEVALGSMNTTTMLKKALGDGEMAVQLYSNYFGPIPYKRLAITQQTACTFGQAWPTLVWLPICAFFDETVRHGLGLDFGDRGYWKVVTPHEVAHQWWGHQVGFNSYRDQWMSEGFADMSASLFIQAVEKNPKKFNEFWNDERELITERNKDGFRAIDVGPLTMGYRLNNSRTGVNITRDLIYPKGAYILQMVRMMMWNGQTGDQDFKAAMQDFVKTYAGRAATTEDFKSTLEKHMTRDMNAGGNGKMDWFFNEYVYGTALPTYTFVGTFDKNPAGEVVFNYSLKQSGVDDNFVMPVPVYFELADGRTVSLGRIQVKGNYTAEGKVALKGMKDPPKRALINFNHDVLASN